MNKTVAVIAAHPDDEVLGCGGTITFMAKCGYSVHMLFIADGETSRQSDTEKIVKSKKIGKRITAAKTACEIMGCDSVEMLSMPDNRLDGKELLDVVKQVELFLAQHCPSIVMTHHAGDVNIDHQVVHNAVIAACRPQPEATIDELLFFEVPSSTEWRPPSSAESFSPNWFVDISTTLQTKLEAMQVYKSELKDFPHPRSSKAVTSLAQWRGATVGVDAAEAFILGRKIIR